MSALNAQHLNDTNYVMILHGIVIIAAISWCMCALSPLEEDSSGADLIPESALPLVPWPKIPDPCRLLPPLVALFTLPLDRADTGWEENAIDEGAREFTLSTLVYWRHIHTQSCYRQWRWVRRECVSLYPTALTVSEDVVQSADTEGWPLLTWLQEKQPVSQIYVAHITFVKTWNQM